MSNRVWNMLEPPHVFSPTGDESDIKRQLSRTSVRGDLGGLRHRGHET